MRDYTYPVVTGMFILGALMILAATTSANAATTDANKTPVVEQANNQSEAPEGEFLIPANKISDLVRQEAALLIEVQRADALGAQAAASASVR